MILLFDDGGDKIVTFHKKGHSVGKFGVNKIWVTDLTGIAGTKEENNFNSIEEVISSLAAKGPGFSSVYSEKGIEVAIYSSSDPDVILVQRYKINNNKPEKFGPAQSMNLNDFRKSWNEYQNTGISTTSTSGWEKN